MEIAEVLTDAFGRVRSVTQRVVADLDAEQLAWRPDPDANPIAWLVWHLTRVQDHHVSELAGREQAWSADGWHDRFGLPADAEDTGFGHGSAQVAAIRPDGPDVLVGYHEAVADRTLGYLDAVDAAALDRVVDPSYDPPVTVGVRLVSVVADSLQHAGQAGYVRGLLERRA